MWKIGEMNKDGHKTHFKLKHGNIPGFYKNIQWERFGCILRRRSGWFLVALVAGMLSLAGCGVAQNAGPSAPDSGSKQGAGVIQVVAAESFYAEAVQAVGGSQVQVYSVLKSGSVDPESFEPTTQTARQVAQARLVVYNGLGYDDWMNKLLNASSSSSRLVINVGNGLWGKQTGVNPHIWYDPQTMPKLTVAIEQDLSQLDPTHTKQFQQNANRYLQQLKEFTDQVQRDRSATSIPVFFSEPVPGYLAQALNMQPIDYAVSLAVEQGIDPAPRDLQQARQDIRSHKIKVFFLNTQTTSPAATTLANDAQQVGIPVVDVTETEPTGKNYVAWMTSQLNQVEVALHGGH